MAFVKSLEDAKAFFKYGLEPGEGKAFEVYVASAKLGKLVIEEGVWTVTKNLTIGIWESVVKSATTAEGYGELAGETALAIARLGIGRAVKGLKTAGRAIEEVMDTVPDTKIGSRDVGLLDKPIELGDVAKGDVSSDIYGKLDNKIDHLQTTKLLPYAEEIQPYAGGILKSFITQQETKFYRVYSDKPLGSFLVKSKPKNRLWAIEALALPPNNDALYIQEVLVPANVRIQKVASSACIW